MVMKRISIAGKILVMLTALILLFSTVSCVTFDSNGKLIPPGQAKKITGDKNAKNLAPGKNK